ncbi:MAG: 4-alpha-glucanotransferase [Pseudomonadota bacterium]
MIALNALAARVGILEGYHRIDGSYHPCAPETAQALLTAMGLPCADEGQAANSLKQIEEETQAGALPGLLVVTADQGSDHDLAPWRMVLETGEEIAANPDAPWHIPALPMGVHLMSSERGATLVIAAPPRAPVQADISDKRPVWGVTTALYGLRSDRHLGVGDFEDLARTAAALGPKGAAFLGINPVHGRGVAEGGYSPYSPSSRTTLETGHIALDTIPEAADCPELDALLAEAADRLDQARAAELVDYPAVRPVHLAGLRALFARFRQGDGPRQQAFAAWAAARPRVQALQSVYEALSTQHGPDWRRWPDGLQDPDGTEVQAFAARFTDEIAFHEWCQWTAEAQLADAQARAQAGGMALGLYLDVAVGVRPGGAETWANRGAFASGASLGAPPDLLNTEGQRWDLAPYSPLGLARQHFAPFRRMLRQTMAAAGMVRIDHIIGFARSYWAPMSGVAGGYVAFPLEAMLALTRIEAARAGCLVVGEDLGTVPDGLRDALGNAGLYGCAILPFEREWVRLRHPNEYRQMTLAAFGTHDLPSIAGWWEGREIATRDELGHPVGPHERDERARDRVTLCHMLAGELLLPGGIDPDHPPPTADSHLCHAIHRLLCRGGADLVAIGLDDIFAIPDQQNVPGTVDEQPNWRRRAPAQVQDLADAPEIVRLAELGPPGGT